MNTTLYLATIGGLISFFSTAAGSLLSLVSSRTWGFSKFKFTIDFALGLMLSSVAFSLVGPATTSIQEPFLYWLSLAGFFIGGFVIYGIKKIIEYTQPASTSTQSAQLILAIALIVHNFPEGLASGAALAGLETAASTPILLSIALQNLPEGLLMVVCLKAMKWSNKASLAGGLLSGAVELVGGVLAGFALNSISYALPILLMTAGGAMFTSVCIEIKEKGDVFKQFKNPQFAAGLLSIPLINGLFL